MEIDVKYVPDLVENKRYYQFTAIDCASRWRYLRIYDEYSNFHSVRFLKELIEIAPFRIRAIKTDNWLSRVWLSQVFKFSIFGKDSQIEQELSLA